MRRGEKWWVTFMLGFVCGGAVVDITIEILRWKHG